MPAAPWLKYITYCWDLNCRSDSPQVESVGCPCACCSGAANVLRSKCLHL